MLFNKRLSVNAYCPSLERRLSNRILLYRKKRLKKKIIAKPLPLVLTATIRSVLNFDERDIGLSDLVFCPSVGIPGVEECVLIVVERVR